MRECDTRARLALVDDAFEKPLPDIPFDEDTVDGAVTEGEIPFVAVPRPAGRTVIPPFAGRPPRACRLHHHPTRDAATVGGDANGPPVLHLHACGNREAKSPERSPRLGAWMARHATGA